MFIQFILVKLTRSVMSIILYNNNWLIASYLHCILQYILLIATIVDVKSIEGLM